MLVRTKRFLFLLLLVQAVAPFVHAKKEEPEAAREVSVVRSHVLPTVKYAGLSVGALAALAWWHTGKTIKKLGLKKTYLQDEVDGLGVGRLEREEQAAVKKALTDLEAQIAMLQAYNAYAKKALIAFGGAGAASFVVEKVGDHQGWWDKEEAQDNPDKGDGTVATTALGAAGAAGALTGKLKFKMPKLGKKVGGLNEEEQAKAWSGLEKVFGKVAPGQRPAGALVRVAHLLHLKDAKKLVEEVGTHAKAEDFNKQVLDRATWSILQRDIAQHYPDEGFVLPAGGAPVEIFDKFDLDGNGAALFEATRAQLQDQLKGAMSGKPLTVVRAPIKPSPLSVYLQKFAEIGVQVPKTGVTEQELDRAAEMIGFDSVQDFSEADRDDIEENINDGAWPLIARHIKETAGNDISADRRVEALASYAPDDTAERDTSDSEDDGEADLAGDAGTDTEDDEGEGVDGDIPTKHVPNARERGQKVFDHLKKELFLDKVAQALGAQSTPLKKLPEPGNPVAGVHKGKTVADVPFSRDGHWPTVTQPQEDAPNRLGKWSAIEVNDDEDELDDDVKKQLAARRAYALSRLLLLQSNMAHDNLSEVFAIDRSEKYVIPVDTRDGMFEKSNIVAHAPGNGSSAFHALWHGLRNHSERWPDEIKELDDPFNSQDKAVAALRKDIAAKGAKIVQSGDLESPLALSVVKRIRALLQDWGTDPDCRAFVAHVWPDKEVALSDENNRAMILAGIGHNPQSAARLLQLLNSTSAITEAKLQALTEKTTTPSSLLKGHLAKAYKAFVEYHAASCNRSSSLMPEDLSLVVAHHYAPCIMLIDRGGDDEDEAGLAPAGIIGDASTIKNIAKDALWLVESSGHYNALHPRLLLRTAKLIDRNKARGYTDPLALSHEEAWKLLANTFKGKVVVPADEKQQRDYRPLTTIAQDFGFDHPQDFFDAFARAKDIKPLLDRATWRYLQHKHHLPGEPTKSTVVIDDWDTLKPFAQKTKRDGSTISPQEYFVFAKKELVTHYGIQGVKPDDLTVADLADV